MDTKKEKVIMLDENEIIQALSEWLGEAGVVYFRNILQKYGTLLAVWDEGGLPHCVHFREGMMVRNKLRDIIPSMGDHWYDDNWARLVEQVLLKDEAHE